MGKKPSLSSYRRSDEFNLSHAEVQRPVFPVAERMRIRQEKHRAFGSGTLYNRTRPYPLPSYDHPMSHRTLLLLNLWFALQWLSPVASGALVFAQDAASRPNELFVRRILLFSTKSAMVATGTAKSRKVD